MLLITVTFLIISSPLLVYSATFCDLPANLSSSFVPVIFNSENEIRYPGKFGFRFKSNEIIKFGCPNTKRGMNKLTVENTDMYRNILTAECIQNDRVRIGNQECRSTDIKCENIVRGTVHPTDETCGTSDKGFRFLIQFKFGEKDVQTLYEICHNPKDVITYYSQHTLLGSKIQYSETRDNVRFETDGIHDCRDIDTLYTRADRKEKLKSFCKRHIFELDLPCIDKGHLAPSADFATNPLQHSSYFFLNVHPQWTKINLGNWKEIEMNVRKFAKMNPNMELKIYTGTYDVLELYCEKLYLDDTKKKVPIPKYTWKIVYSKVNHHAIVFVAYNSPYWISSTFMLCEDICENNHWKFRDPKNFSKGFIYCCEYKSFILKINTKLPIKVKGILQNQAYMVDV